MAEQMTETATNGRRKQNEMRGRHVRMTRFSLRLGSIAAVAFAAVAIAAPAAWAVNYIPRNEHTVIGGTEGFNHGEYLARGIGVDPVTHDLYGAGMFFEGRIHRWDGTTEAETIFGREEFLGYYGVTVDPSTHIVYALNATTKRMEKFFPSGKKPTPAFFQTEGLGNIEMGPEGHLFVPKSPGKFGSPIFPGGEGAILEYSKSGELLHTIECTACPGVPAFDGPVKAALDAAGDLYVADSENNRVIKMERVAGQFVNPTVFSTGPSTSVAVDRATGRVFVGGQATEEAPFLVTVYDSNGNQIDQFGDGLFQDRFGAYGGGDQIGIDQGTGGVWVGDFTHVEHQNVFGEPFFTEEVRYWEFQNMLPPSAEADPATVEASRHATLNATVNPNGNLVRNCHFEYGTTTAYGSSIPCSPDPGFEREPEATSSEVTGLQPNTTYHYRVVVTNEGGTVESGDEEFTTLIDKPVVATGGPANVTPFGATLSGSVNPLSNSIEFCRFEYGPTAAYGSEAACPSNPGSGGSPVSISLTLQNLSPSTTYHYRLVAGNAGGTEMGADATFTTLPHDPTTTTGGAVNVLPDGAKLLGKVNAQGSVTSYRFEFGASTGYGQSTPAGSVVGSTDEAVSAVIGSLAPNTTYHFRLAATNAGGTTYGADQTFTTLIRPVGHATIPARAGIKHGSIMIPLTCKGEAIAECQGTLTVRARIKKGIRFILVKIGSASYDFFGKQTKEIEVRLNGNGHKVLGQSEGKAIRAVASAGGANREMRLFAGHRHHGSRHGRHHSRRGHHG